MFALSGLFLFKPIQKQGGANMENQQVKTKIETAKVKKLVGQLMGTSRTAMTSEEWQRLEGKKQIKTSEQVRFYMRNH